MSSAQRKTNAQISGIILVQCLTVCNEAKLDKVSYLELLQNLLDVRGMKVNAKDLVEELEQL